MKGKLAVAVMLFALAVPTFGQARRRAVSHSPKPKFRVDGIMLVVPYLQSDGSITYYVAAAVGSLPPGEKLTINGYKIDPTSGDPEEIYHNDVLVPNFPGLSSASVFLWGQYGLGKALPSEWRSGTTGYFKIEVTGENMEPYTMLHPVKVGDPKNLVGPLQTVQVFPNGDIFFTGVFPTPPVAAIWGIPVPVRPGNWITPVTETGLKLYGPNQALSIGSGEPKVFSTWVGAILPSSSSFVPRDDF